MRERLRRLLSVVVGWTLVLAPWSTALSQTPGPQTQAPAQLTLHAALQLPYEQLFALAPTLSFPSSAFKSERSMLQKGETACRRRFKADAKDYAKQIEQARKQLKAQGSRLSNLDRHNLHCRIQNLDLLRSEAEVLAGQGIPTAYDNLAAKLDLLQYWPAQYAQARRELASGVYRQRRWGDVQDIGFRQIAAGQPDDIKRGQQAIEELRRSRLLPPDLPNADIQRYVNEIAQRIARNSDLKIPLHVVVLQSREVNAFALPGGYLFVERGVLEEADDEAELAGVIAHEIAHDAARHGAKLMKRATIAGIFYQAAQVAAVLLTGGVAGAGLYYALQYGFYGLGLVINLNLLGVSRDFELQADQLGIQYAWKAGYDPEGFILFFDKMATKAGYIKGVSWFRTHPPFYTRMVNAQREIMFLPAHKQSIVQTSQFLEMKQRLAPITAAAEREDEDKPSLLISREEGCTPPRKIEYQPGQSVEQLCAGAQTAPAGTR